jgi:hypothetical protein
LELANKAGLPHDIPAGTRFFSLHYGPLLCKKKDLHEASQSSIMDSNGSHTKKRKRDHGETDAAARKSTKADSKKAVNGDAKKSADSELKSKDKEARRKEKAA